MLTMAAASLREFDFALSARLPMITSTVTEAEWNEYVASHPQASGYHLWGWRRVFERAFGHRTVYLAARGAGRITGVLPLVLFEHALFGRFGVSLPFVNYGGVLASSATAAGALVEAASRLAGACRLSHLELRHRERQFANLPVRQHKVAMLLDLPGTAAECWEGLDRKVRNQVRKAEKSGLTAVTGGAELLDEFYAVFARNMRDLGTPVYDRRWFEEILREFPARTRVFLVKHGEKTVAGAISYACGDMIEVPWASSLRDYRSMCPNNLLYWHIIQHAIKGWFRVFDFGRSTPHEGTYEFKKQWGAQPVPLHWEYSLMARTALPDRSPKNPKARAAIAVWQRLPLSIASTLGPAVARYLP